jgi:CheY-like chemotaxis protein
VARSAREAFKLLQALHPDIMVSDIGMPFEDGYELIRKVRALPEVNGGRVPAVALSAYARPEDRMKALRAGYQMHVAKPVQLNELVSIVASLANRLGDRGTR